MEKTLFDWQEVEMDINLAALVAAVAASVGVLAHGVVGQMWLSAQLGTAEMEVTPLSTQLFGPSDVSAQIFGVAWHCITAVFLAAAGALYLTAFGAIASPGLLRFIAILYLAFLAVGGFYLFRGPRLLRGAIPPLFVTVMVGSAVLSWVASNSV
jgi:hypothetical protein